MINKECIYRADAILACYDGFASCVDDCATNIRNLPTANVVEVVRCRDCRHWNDTDDGPDMVKACTKAADKENGTYYGFLDYTGEDFFCADGELRVCQ